MRNSWMLAGMLLTVALLCSSCTTGKNTPASTPVEAAVVVTDVADPEAALRDIYALFPDSSTEVMNKASLKEIADIPPEDIDSVFAYRSDAKKGLCDTILLVPAQGKEDTLREALYAYKEKRVEEFRNYDILDAYAIAQGAVVYEQGDYLILLMLPDNEPAQDIIDLYIPQ